MPTESGFVVEYLVRREQWQAFLEGIAGDRHVYALSSPHDGPVHLQPTDILPASPQHLAPYRSVEPLKTLFFPPRESLGPLMEGRRPSLPERLVLGVKNCDLSALQIHDHVFLDTEPVDPYYAEARRKTLLVSSDCTDAPEVCFCTAVGEQPYPVEGFDLNLSPVSQGAIVETGSERGEAALESLRADLAQAESAHLEERNARRERLAHRVAGQAEAGGLRAGLDLQHMVERSREASLWEEFAQDCVECGACNFVCCTCHCFLLADGLDSSGRPARAKLWDSCLYRNFARVAGGANPRAHRTERLYNRFEKKFSFFPRVLERYACDGCGRCIEACTGRIDIRAVLKRAADES